MWLKHVKAILTQLYYVVSCTIFQIYPKFCPYSPRESLFTPHYGTDQLLAWRLVMEACSLYGIEKFYQLVTLGLANMYLKQWISMRVGVG